MNRRRFLKASAAVSASSALPGALFPAWAAQESEGKWRTFEVTTRVEVLKPVGVTRVWLPTPLMAETPYQKPLGNNWSSEGAPVSFLTDPHYGAGIVMSEWTEEQKPVLILTSRFSTQDIAVDLKAPGRAPAEKPEVLKLYLAATDLLPTDGIVKDTAMEATKGAKTDLEKARAIYEWTVDNTFRDPKVRGCGVGDVKFMLETKNMGGKCGDINAVFVALARSLGIPARDVYGIRVADSRLGYKSLGKSGDITKAQHCRAEFYLAGYGWVPVDPGDVRKVVLEEEGGEPIDDPKVIAARERLFGSWEMNWLAYNTAHDLALPKSARGKIGFFMYPNAETAEGRLDSLDPDNFKYQITAKEIAA
jgi:transglutaminase-like putative cysteine protease